MLTTAGILAMNSDGADSHPLKRGIWLLKRILQDPPPPPPANVPKVDLTDPRILEMTLKERIADHRSKPACISCHSRIDPWGIAFENYDALGAWRTSVKNKPVDATLIDELRRHARVLARLDRIGFVANEQKDDDAMKRVTALLTDEFKRHASEVDRWIAR